MPKQSGLLHFFSRQQWMFLIGTVLLFILIARPSSFYFLNDDLIHIPLSAKGIFGHHNSVRYIGDLSLMMDLGLYQQQAWGFHLTNLLLHIANVFLLLMIIKRFYAIQELNISKWSIIYALSLFLVFAFHSDAVFWIIGRSASLGTLFFLMTVYFFIAPIKLNALKTFAISLSWLLALFSYESVWLLPILLTVIYLNTSKIRVSTIRHRDLILVWILFLAYMVLRWKVTGAWLGTYEAKHIEVFSPGVLIINFAKLLSRSFIPPLSAPIIHIILGMLIALVFVFSIFQFLRKGLSCVAFRVLFFGWLLSYLPYLSLGISMRSIESERFLYLPSLFLSVLFFYVLFQLLKEKSGQFWIHGTALLILCSHGLIFYANAQSYQSAGSVVRKTYDQLSESEIRISDTLTIENLPKTIHGIPTFRLGFEDGYIWLLGPKPYIHVKDSMSAIYPVKARIIEQPSEILLRFEEIKP